MLKGDTSNCLFWKLAIVQDLLQGNVGQVRAAVVKVLDLQGGVQSLRKSVKYLYPIKVNAEEFTDISENTDHVSESDDISNRKPRQPAIEGD